METDTFGYIVVKTIYTSQTDHLRPNKQFLSTWQHAYHSFWVTSLFYSAYNIATRWVNFREKHLHEYELQLSDNNMGKYCRPNVKISGIKIYFQIFAYELFIVKIKKMLQNLPQCKNKPQAWDRLEKLALSLLYDVRKEAKIRNICNQVPHITKDTI